MCGECPCSMVFYGTGCQHTKTPMCGECPCGMVFDGIGCTSGATTNGPMPLMPPMNGNWADCRDFDCCKNHGLDFDGGVMGCKPPSGQMPPMPAINMGFEECKDTACCHSHGMEFDGLMVPAGCKPPSGPMCGMCPCDMVFDGQGCSYETAGATASPMMCGVCPCDMVELDGGCWMKNELCWDAADGTK